MKPSAGRMVHYVSSGTPAECRAAVVTEVGGNAIPAGPDLTGPDVVGLCVLSPAGLFFNQDVPCDPGPDEGIGTNLCGGKLYRGGTWHWPERVGP
jgi:hypothetical protein